MLLSQIVRSPAFLLACVLGGVALVTLAARLWRRRTVRELAASRAMTIPGLGELLRTVAVTRFLHALSPQLECGITPLAAFPLAAESSGNPVLSQAVTRSVAALVKGASLAGALDATHFFPPLVVHMMRIGEETGTAPGLMKRTAALYDLELELALETLTSLLEPAIMLFTGVLVAVVILATMTPMLTLMRQL